MSNVAPQPTPLEIAHLDEFMAKSQELRERAATDAANIGGVVLQNA